MAAARVLTWPLKPWRRHAAQALAAELLEPDFSIPTDLGALRFHCPTRDSLHFVREFHSREPETLSWIRSFRPGDIFWDIGANVGQFSLYAGLNPGVRTLAFEPGAASYAALARNIETNRMDNRVAAYCVAFDGITRLTELNMARTSAGSSMHAVGTDVDMSGRPIAVKFRQAVTAYSIDDFIASFNPPFPTHLKLDVDSIEDKILDGAKKTLTDRRLCSVLIEIETAAADERTRAIHTLCAAAGLSAAEAEGSRLSANVLFHRA
jgi:FkbM family methyltransferase